MLAISTTPVPAQSTRPQTHLPPRSSSTYKPQLYTTPTLHTTPRLENPCSHQSSSIYQPRPAYNACTLNRPTVSRHPSLCQAQQQAVQVLVSTINTSRLHSSHHPLKLTAMAPTHTISAHLCKEIYKSWQVGRQTSPEPLSRTGPYATPAGLNGNHRSPSPEKRSMDSDRSIPHISPALTPMSRSPPSNSGWRWGGNRS